MAQRSINVDEEILINLQVTVSIKSFSNHNGFTEGQVNQAREEFKDVVVQHLRDKLVGKYQLEEFLDSVDCVNYEVRD